MSKQEQRSDLALPVLQAIQSDFESIEQRSLKDFEFLRITSKTVLPVTTPVVKIGSAPFAAPGNLSALTGQSKVGKTGFLNAVIAGAMSADGKYDGFDDLRIEPNVFRKAVIQIDTEQALDDHQFNIKSVLKRCNLSEDPPHFLSYNFRKEPYVKYRQMLSEICELASVQFGGIFLLVIDGGADFLSTVNDDVESKLMVEFFVHLAIKYNCPVITVVHQNPGTDKERGHFGSEVQRKCYALFSVTKNRDISTLEPKLLRKGGFSDAPLIHYRYDSVKGYHADTQEVDQEAGKAAKNRAKLEAVARSVFAPPAAFKTNEAIRQIAKHSNLSESQAKRNLKDLQVWEVVIKHPDEYIRLNLTGVMDSGVIQGHLGPPF
jgi:hypothetical protein